MATTTVALPDHLSRRVLHNLRRLMVATPFGLLAIFVISQMDSILPKLVIAAMAVVTLAIVAVVAIDWRWKPLLGVLVFGLLQIPLAVANIGHELAPTYHTSIVFILLLIALVLLTVGLSVVSQCGHFAKQHRQRWLPGVIFLVAGAIVAVIAATQMASGS
jgi:hypothetical protein